MSFAIFPQFWSFSPFNNANLPDYSSARTPWAAQGPWQLLAFGEVQNPVVQTSFSLSLAVALSLLPMLCLRTLLEVAAKPSPSFLSCPPAAVGGSKLVLVERMGQQGKLPRQEALESALSGY